MYFGGLYHAKLAAASLSASAADTEVDLSKNFVEPGKRPIAAVLTAYNGVSSDSGVFDYKLQESNTTVDSDFTDITGAAFTQLNEGSTVAPEQIQFNTTKRYVRGYHTVTSGAWEAVAELILTKRDG
jgi:hypothetical protein